MNHNTSTNPELRYRHAKPKEREYTILDSEGLYMVVQPSGSKYWIFRYSFEGKRSKIHIGTYPDVPLRGYLLKGNDGLKQWINGSRDSAEEYRKLIRVGIDPRREAFTPGLPPPVPETRNSLGGVQLPTRPRYESQEVATGTDRVAFRIKAEEWFKVQARTWCDTNQKDVKQRLEKDIYPVIGDKPVQEVGEADALRIFNAIMGRDSDVLAVRVVEYVERILRFSGCDGFKVSTLRERGYLTRRRPVRHHPACSRIDQFAAFLRDLEAVENRESLKLGTKLLALFFCRPGALQKAEWSEIDFNRAEWIIPGDRAGCKRKKYELDRPHIVPLSRQAVGILYRLRELSVESRFVLPSRFNQDEAISNAAFGNFLKQLGYKDNRMLKKAPG